MPFYIIKFKNHGGHVFGVEGFAAEHDEAAIEKAHFKHVPAIGYGFDLWDGDRLVHSYPKHAPESD